MAAVFRDVCPPSAARARGRVCGPSIDAVGKGWRALAERLIDVLAFLGVTVSCCVLLRLVSLVLKTWLSLPRLSALEREIE